MPRTSAAVHPRFYRSLLLVSGLLITACGGSLPPDRTAERVTSSGAMVGEHIPATETRPAVDVYRGIPYAAPPVGELRWTPPQDPEPWDGTREMIAFGPRCPQTSRDGSAPEIPDSEDCLTLNIWTTSDRSGQRPNPTIVPEQRPVFVWIHGGGFRTGSGSAAYSDGARFVEDGAVLVSINYRLGALGFLAHPVLLEEQPAANFGLLDMRQALSWVKRNIAQFNGDPENVTIFGESAGGMAVQLLMSDAAGYTLFQQAISMSGYGTWPLPRVPAMIPEGKEGVGENPLGNRAEAPILDAAVMGEAVLARATEAAGLASSADIRAIPAEALNNAIASLHLPIVDGASLADEPAIVFARGEQAQAPYLVGGNSYDGAVMAMAGLSPDTFLGSWGPWQDDLRELYQSDFAISDGLGASRLFGDGRYLLAARRTARSMQTVGQPGFLYYLDYVPPEHRGTWPGTPHAAELAGLFDAPSSFDDPDSPSNSDVRAVGANLRRLFVEFAKTRQPSSEWPVYTEDNDQWFVVGREGGTSVEAGVLKDKLDFLEARYEERLEEQGLR